MFSHLVHILGDDGDGNIRGVLEMLLGCNDTQLISLVHVRESDERSKRASIASWIGIQIEVLEQDTGYRCDYLGVMR